EALGADGGGAAELPAVGVERDRRGVARAARQVETRLEAGASNRGGGRERPGGATGVELPRRRLRRAVPARPEGALRRRERRRHARAADPREAQRAVVLPLRRQLRVEQQLAVGAVLAEVRGGAPADEDVAVVEYLRAAERPREQRRVMRELALQGRRAARM